MKKRAFVLCFVLSLLTSSLLADISIQWVNQTDCYPGYRSGYFQGVRNDTTFSGDTALRIIHWGDGAIDTFATPVNGNSLFFLYKTHQYTTTGNIQLFYKIVWPDNVVDSMSQFFTISPQCGSISGRVFLDNNQDCNYNSGSDKNMSIMVQLIDTSGTFIRYAHTDTGGMYYFNQIPTNSEYYISIPDSNYSLSSGNVICPTQAEYHIDTLPIDSQDFAVSCSGVDLIPYMKAYRFRPALGATHWTKVNNLLCDPTVAEAEFVVGDTNLDSIWFNNFFNVVASSFLNDTLTYQTDSVSALVHYDTSGVYLTSNSFGQALTDTFANIGDSVCFTAFVTPDANETDTLNNNRTTCWPITNSWDPNYIAVFPSGRAGGGRIRPNQWMTYTIHFQNNGNDTAYNIRVHDTIDMTKLDMGSVRILSASHRVQLDVVGTNNDVLNFRFDDIYLPDSNTNAIESQGEVVFAILQKPDLAPGTVFKNRAAIFFDFNHPIITNQTINTIDENVDLVYNLPPADSIPIVPIDTNDTTINDSILSNLTLRSESVLTVYPNPTSDVIYLRAQKLPRTLYMTDLKGQIVRHIIAKEVENNSILFSISLGDIPAGAYELIGIMESGQRVHKTIIKQ